MQLELIYQSHHENLSEFHRKTIKSNWDTLIFVADGAYSFIPESRQKAITVQKNEIAFIPAHVEFKRWIEMPVTYYNLCFSRKGDHPFYVAASLGKFKLPQKQSEAILESIAYASLFPENRELITHLIEHVFTQNYLFRNMEKTTYKPLSIEVENAIRYMRKHLDQKIDIDELAKQVFLSHIGLIWKFRRELDTTPSNYLYLLRMQQAKQLLLNYTYSITEISELCGYQNPYYFTNAFHKYSGMSPSEFRKFHLGNKT